MLLLFIMEIGLQNHNRDGLLGPMSIMAVYMEPLGKAQNSKNRHFGLWSP